jgi:hypothetical protein
VCVWGGGGGLVEDLFNVGMPRNQHANNFVSSCIW